MNMVFGPQGPHVYGFESLDKWANKKYEAGLSVEGIPAHRRMLRRTVDMRYQGEAYEIEVDFPSGYLSPATVATVVERYHLLYQLRFTYNHKGKRSVEIVHLRVTGVGLTEPPNLPLKSPTSVPSAASLVLFMPLPVFPGTGPC